MSKDDDGLFKTGTPERLIQRLEHATVGNLFHCEADLEDAVEIATEEMAAAKVAPFSQSELAEVRTWLDGSFGPTCKKIAESLTKGTYYKDNGDGTETPISLHGNEWLPSGPSRKKSY